MFDGRVDRVFLQEQLIVGLAKGFQSEVVGAFEEHQQFIFVRIDLASAIINAFCVFGE